jgi:hypothetical protein
MNSTLLERSDNRKVYAVVWAREAGRCVLCHSNVRRGDKVIVHQRGGMEHADLFVCLSHLPPGTREFVGYLGDS